MKRFYRILSYLILVALFAAPALSQDVSRGVTTWHADENFIIDVQNEFNVILGLINGPKPVGIPYDFIAVPAANVVLRFATPVALTFPANLAAGTPAPASVCNAKTVPTADTVFSIQRDDVQIATATFAAGSHGCTFSTQASFTMAATETLSIVSSGSPDATIANIAITIGAYR